MLKFYPLSTLIILTKYIISSYHKNIEFIRSTTLKLGAFEERNTKNKFEIVHYHGLVQSLGITRNLRAALGVPRFVAIELGRLALLEYKVCKYLKEIT